MIGFLLHKNLRHKFWYFAGAFVLIVVGLVFIFSFPRAAEDSEVIIILSPHADDAKLSLGEFVSDAPHPVVVATFFADDDGAAADPERNLALEIQTLLVAYGDKTISAYGPAIFPDDIGNADHAALHRAFVDVLRGYPKKDISFYFYEDYPYAEQFRKSSVISLERYLEKQTGFLFEKTDNPVAYKVFRIKE